MTKISYNVDVSFQMSPDHIESLVLLYQPVFAYPVMSLYLTLYEKGRRQRDVDVRDLLHSLQIDVNQLEMYRQELERFALLRTFKTQDSLRCVLIKPLRPESFLNHVTFGRLYAVVMGNSAFIEACQNYRIPQNNQSGEEEISAFFDLQRLSSWDHEAETVFVEKQPDLALQHASFDVERFFKSMSTQIFPMIMRTEEVKRMVGDCGSFYNMSFNDMKAKVIAASNFETKQFDIRKFQMLVDRDHGRQSVNTVSNPYDLDPLSYLAYKQDHDYIVDADKNLLKSLEANFKFSHHVINVLIEYVLENNSMNLNRSYVEKIAATWKRKGIDSLEKAQAETIAVETNKRQPKSNVKVEVKMPEYSQDTSIDGDVEEYKKRLEAALKGGKS